MPEPLKIVHVLPALTKGGGERVVVELANAAARQGHAVTVLAAFPVDPSVLQHLLDPSIDVVFTSPHRNKYTGLLPWIWKQRQWLKSQDILHCHLTYGAFFGTIVHVLKKLSGKRKPFVIETYHAVGMAIPSHHQWLHAKMATHRDALVLMATDKYWEKFMRRHPRLHTQIIPNGTSIAELKVDEEQKKAYRKSIGIPESCRLVVGTIGRIHPDRQPLRYIPIFAEILNTLGPDVHFVMAGEGPEMPAVKEAIRQAGIEDNVHLPGLALDTSLPFSIFDLYVSLNVGAITGISVLEATLHGIPAVCIQLLPNYRSSGDDWVWSSTDSNEIALKMIGLLQNDADRSELARRQHQYARQHHSTESMAAAYESIYTMATD